MLLNRYTAIEYIENMKWSDGIELINKAFKKRSEEKDWEVWVSLYPHFDKNTFIPFDKFKSKHQIKAKKTKELTKEELIEQAEEIRMLHQGTHEGVRKE